MKQALPHTKQHGFTVIELMVVVVILVILGTLVALTYSGVQAKDRNGTRQTTVQKLQGQLETYYAQTTKYPTLAQLNSAAWRQQNTKLAADGLRDPRWNASNKNCTSANQATAASQPATNCYSYQVTSADGSACNNTTVDCAHYTLTAKLEGGDNFVKSSLN